MRCGHQGSDNELYQTTKSPFFRRVLGLAPRPHMHMWGAHSLFFPLFLLFSYLMPLLDVFFFFFLFFLPQRDGRPLRLSCAPYPPSHTAKASEREKKRASAKQSHWTVTLYFFFRPCAR